MSSDVLVYIRKQLRLVADSREIMAGLGSSGLNPQSLSSAKAWKNVLVPPLAGVEPWTKKREFLTIFEIRIEIYGLTDCWLLRKIIWKSSLIYFPIKPNERMNAQTTKSALSKKEWLVIQKCFCIMPYWAKLVDLLVDKGWTLTKI